MFTCSINSHIGEKWKCIIQDLKFNLIEKKVKFKWQILTVNINTTGFNQGNSINDKTLEPWHVSKEFYFKFLWDTKNDLCHIRKKVHQVKMSQMPLLRIMYPKFSLIIHKETTDYIGDEGQKIIKKAM